MPYKFQFIDNSDDIKNATVEKIEQVLETWGLFAEGQAQENITAHIPRNVSGTSFGALRNSLSHRSVVSEKTVYVGTNQSYAVYNELGTGIYADGKGRQTPWSYQDERGKWHTTKGITPIHFLRDAIQNNLDTYKKMAEDILKS